MGPCAACLQVAADIILGGQDCSPCADLIERSPSAEWGIVMATSSQQEQPVSTADVLSALEPTDDFDAVAPDRRNGAGRWLVRAFVALVVVGLGAAGYAMLTQNLGADDNTGMLTHEVQRRDLLITITEDGYLESASNLDIKCEVAGGSTILEIVEDGKLVEKGELLARLDSSQLEEQISQQNITFEKANATYIQAEKDHKVAEIALQEYLEGTYRLQLQDLETQITIALENLRAAENTLRHTERMFRKGYVSPLQRDSQQFAVERSKLELESARTAKDVLQRFTRMKTVEELQAQRDIAEAKKKSEKAGFELEKARLSRLQAQLTKCVIYAPQAGMVVYANEQSRHRFGSQQSGQVEEGATVREQQTMFRLPDLTEMQVKVAVHESKVDQVARGLRARIRIQDRECQGTVLSVANQPESTSFFSANVKEYATIVKIDGEQEGLKPGMTAEAEILIDHLKDVVTLPVAAIVEQRGKMYCWVKLSKRIERRSLVLGLSNDKFVEIKDGVAPGEHVILNPRAVVADANDQRDEAETVDVEKDFGSAPKGLPPESGRAAGPPRREGPPGAGGPRPPRASGPRDGAAPDASGPDRRGGPGQRGPGQGGPGQRGPGRGGRGDLMQLDKDGDGKVSREEAPEGMRRFFDRLDGNGDGFIDKAEADAMSRRFESGGGRGPRPQPSP